MCAPCTRRAPFWTSPNSAGEEARDWLVLPAGVRDPAFRAVEPLTRVTAPTVLFQGQDHLHAVGIVRDQAIAGGSVTYSYSIADVSRALIPAWTCMIVCAPHSPMQLVWKS